MTQAQYDRIVHSVAIDSLCPRGDVAALLEAFEAMHRAADKALFDGEDRDLGECLFGEDGNYIVKVRP